MHPFEGGADRPRMAAAAMALEHCLLLVRHGQTLLNVEDRMATTTDVDLTEKGVRQAGDVRMSLVGAQFDRAYASPLKRARDTTDVALEHATLGHPLIIDGRSPNRAQDRSRGSGSLPRVRRG